MKGQEKAWHVSINQSINDLLSNINKQQNGWMIKIRSNLQRDEMDVQKSGSPELLDSQVDW